MTDADFSCSPILILKLVSYKPPPEYLGQICGMSPELCDLVFFFMLQKYYLLYI